jgi:micrococcal nuclease
VIAVKLICTLIIGSLLIFSTPAFALEGKVVGVSDGDTIAVLTPDKTQHKIRLYGIDCPEKHQDFGQKAKQFASDMVFGKEVVVEVIDKDRYGRTVGIVMIAGKSLNEELVKSGYAWVWDLYCKRPICDQWRLLQEQAWSDKKGLWSHPDPVAPWEFRRGKSKGKLGVAGPLHGNTMY